MTDSLIEALVRDAERAEAAVSAEYAAIDAHDHGPGEPCSHPPKVRRAPRRAAKAPPREDAEPTVEVLRGRLLTADAQRTYVLSPRAGGSGTITLVSAKTGGRYTYKVSAPKAETGGDTCAKCHGTGLWNNRAGYKCFACKGTGEPVAKDAPPDMLFVKLLTGSDNESDYTYLGLLRMTPHPRYEHGRNSPISPEAPGARAIGWYLARLLSGAPVDGVEVWHEGRCGRCGRKLSVPESIEAGFGEECAAKMGL